MTDGQCVGRVLEFRTIITDTDVRAEPGTLFVYGDDMADVPGAETMATQTSRLRMFENAIGLPVKRRPGLGPDCFFFNKDIAIWNKLAAPKVERLMLHQGLVVWPAGGIGLEKARLQQNAPKIAGAIERLQATLAARGRVSDRADEFVRVRA